MCLGEACFHRSPWWGQRGARHRMHIAISRWKFHPLCICVWYCEAITKEFVPWQPNACVLLVWLQLILHTYACVTGVIPPLLISYGALFFMWLRTFLSREVKLWLPIQKASCKVGGQCNITHSRKAELFLRKKFRSVTGLFIRLICCPSYLKAHRLFRQGNRWNLSDCLGNTEISTSKITAVHFLFKSTQPWVM